MTRYKAASLHLAISVALAAMVLCVMFLLWYPGEYFKLMGGGGLILIMLGVDVCLGPLLTLVVFKSGKKTLKFDLAVIGLLQLAALLYGNYVMFNARPILTVFSEDHFQVISASDIEPDRLAKAIKPEWKKPSLTGPQLVATRAPATFQEKSDVSLANAFGLGLEAFPEFYVDYAKESARILNKAKTIKELKGYSQKQLAELQARLGAYAKGDTGLKFLPIRSTFHQMLAAIDGQDAKLVDIIDVQEEN